MIHDTFTAHGMCLLWDPFLIRLHVLSDFTIMLAYFTIPVLLAIALRMRRLSSQPINLVIYLFCAFITLCGLTHLLAIWTIWSPVYYLEGAVKAATAIVSVVTAGVLVVRVRTVIRRIDAALVANDKDVMFDALKAWRGVHAHRG